MTQVSDCPTESECQGGGIIQYFTGRLWQFSAQLLTESTAVPFTP